MKHSFLSIILLTLFLSINSATASTISSGGAPGSGGSTPVGTPNDYNVLVNGNLYIDYSVLGVNQNNSIASVASFTANSLFIFSFEQLPTQPDLSVTTILNELNLSLNITGDILLFSDTTISSGIFEAPNIYLGNYSLLQPVPLPSSLILFLSGILLLIRKMR